MGAPSRRLSILFASLLAGVIVQIGLYLFKPAPDRGDFDVDGGFGYLEEPRIELLYAGLEPRSELRLHPTPGRREFQLTMWNEMSGGDALLGVTADTEVQLRVRAWIEDVQDDGTFTWRWKVLDADVVKASVEGQMVRPATGDLLGALTGLTGYSVVAARGFVLRSVLQGGGKESSPALRQAVAQLLQEPSLHLPAEPVGERAIWTVHRRERRDGAVVVAADRFELQTLRGDQLDVTVKGTETALPQLLAEDRLLTLINMKTELVRLRGDGGGEWTFALDGQLTISGGGWLDRTSDLRIGLSGLQQELRLSVQRATAIDPL
jgi:hypothetical protein